MRAGQGAEHQAAPVRGPVEAEQFGAVTAGDVTYRAAGGAGDQHLAAAARPEPRERDVAPVGRPVGEAVGIAVRGFGQQPRRRVAGRLHFHRAAIAGAAVGLVGNLRTVRGQRGIGLEPGRGGDQPVRPLWAADHPAAILQHAAGTGLGRRALQQQCGHHQQRHQHGQPNGQQHVATVAPPAAAYRRRCRARCGARWRRGYRVGRRRHVRFGGRRHDGIVGQHAYRHQQAVPGLGDGFDVRGAVAVVAGKRLAQLGDSLGEDIIGGQGVGPHLGEQFIAGDHRTGRTQQRFQYAQRLGGEPAHATRTGHRDLARGQRDGAAADTHDIGRRRLTNVADHSSGTKDCRTTGTQHSSQPTPIERTARFRTCHQRKP